MIGYLNENGLKICNDNIIRDKNNHPKCPNILLQELVVELQSKPLDHNKETLYGQLVMSLVEIVLNNKHFKYQAEEIKDDCRIEAYPCILEGCKKTFDSSKGKAYSYAFRCAYTSMIHVLERNNKNNEMIEKIREELEELLTLENSGRKVTNLNID